MVNRTHEGVSPVETGELDDVLKACQITRGPEQNGGLDSFRWIRARDDARYLFGASRLREVLLYATPETSTDRCHRVAPTA